METAAEFNQSAVRARIQRKLSPRCACARQRRRRPNRCRRRRGCGFAVNAVRLSPTGRLRVYSGRRGEMRRRPPEGWGRADGGRPGRGAGLSVPTGCGSGRDRDS